MDSDAIREIGIISVDDHVIETAGVFLDRLPARFRSEGPRLERLRGRAALGKGTYVLVPDETAGWVDCWVYEDLVAPLTTGFAAVSFADKTQIAEGGITFDDIRPGAFDQSARLADMDLIAQQASLCFPTFPRFCGQTFLEAKDRELALACVRAYNDWMIDDWCAGAGYGRLIPMTLVPLWDVQLAADEVRRCAAKGSHAIAFSELPHHLGLPTIHGGHWDPLWRACEETDTVVNLHIGSSSTSQTSAPDAPKMAYIVLLHMNSTLALVDWLLSGTLERLPRLRIAFSEGQVGWMPFQLERMDKVWEDGRKYGGVEDLLPRPPSSYLPDRVFGCVFDDLHGLASRDAIGMSQIMFEVDYPHRDSTWPNTLTVAEKITSAAQLDERETRLLLRENAIRCYGLGRFGIPA